MFSPSACWKVETLSFEVKWYKIDVAYGPSKFGGVLLVGVNSCQIGQRPGTKGNTAKPGETCLQAADLAADNWDTAIFYGKGTERSGSTRQNDPRTPFSLRHHHPTIRFGENLGGAVGGAPPCGKTVTRDETRAQSLGTHCVPMLYKIK